MKPKIVPRFATGESRNRWRFPNFALILSLSLCLVLVSLAEAQSGSTKRANMYMCREQPIGLYTQVTDGKFNISKGYYDGIRVMNEADVKDHRWTLEPLDEVDPTYKFLLYKSEGTADGKCSETIDVAGQLASPIGKVFDFKEAKYNFASRTLRLTTVERDGWFFEAEIQFYPTPEIVKLKAIGKDFGTMEKEFKISYAGIE